MRMRLRARRPGPAVLVGLVVVPLVVLGGAAAAFWTGAGAGAGSGTTGTAEPLVLTPATPAADLYPGARTDVVLTAVNHNVGPVTLASLRLDTARGDGGFAVDAIRAGCDTSALTFTGQDNAGTGWTVPGREGDEDGSLSIRLPHALAMSANAADACQGAVITVYLSAAP
jgi:hypothetical protein